MIDQLGIMRCTEIVLVNYQFCFILPINAEEGIQMKVRTLHRSIYWAILPIGILGVLFLFKSEYLRGSYGHENQREIDQVYAEFSSDFKKQKGAHVFGRLDSTNLQPLLASSYEWITLVSWCNQEDYDSPFLDHHYGDSLHIKKRDSSWVKRIEKVRAAGFKVFVKPHIWIQNPSGGKWRSDIYPSSEEHWETWKMTYRNFILRYARNAEQGQAEMFCIGTELSKLSTKKSEFWIELIKEVRTIYSGQLTYAANWYKEYEDVEFWDQLDFIGIQAYFPLVDAAHPSTKDISNGWGKYLAKMKQLHTTYDRKVLFTELGYKSTATSAIKPWEWLEKDSDLDQTLSLETQANCYTAFFETVWDKDWFAGVHIWQLRSNPRREKLIQDRDFTPQGKPAEQIIASAFRK